MALRVRNVDPLSKKNSEAHHTSEFEGQDGTLFLRRGQVFNIVQQLNRPYEEAKDSATLIFQFVPRASTAKEALGLVPALKDLHEEEKFEVFSPEVPVRGIRGSVVVTPHAAVKLFKVPRLSNDIWDAVVTEFKKNELAIQVMVPANAQVGYWKMTIETACKGVEGNNRLICPHALLVLFNPWCPEDLVYTEDKHIRKLYIQRERIRVCYRGGTQMWNTAQFTTDTIQCVLQLLGRVSKIRPLERANPILVSRALCRGMNSDGVGGVDDNGLIVGNWEDYVDGTKPWDWHSSQEIFKQYIGKGTSVKYGQCYTFAAVMVSACRALGIPCRSVTAYSPGVDVDASLTIDESNEPTEEKNRWNKDFNWHFHVWNEVWMARPDLPEGYGGWQALDSCPVRGFRLGVLTNIGPVPVKAIKEGHVGIGYDAHIMFSAVNADVLNFRDGKLYNISTDEIGEQVIVEKVADEALRGREVAISYEEHEGVAGTEDITSSYKYPEGSPEERAAVRRAMCHVQCVYGVLKDGVIKRKPIPRTFEMKLMAGVGGPNFVRFDNLSGEKRLVKYEIEAIKPQEENEDDNDIPPLYKPPKVQNGLSEHKISIQQGEVTLEPHKSILQKVQLDGENSVRNIAGNEKVFLTVEVTRP